MERTSEIYKKLYHYTTWQGLKEILQTQSLWATNYKFLNDYSELVSFRDKLVSLIYPVARETYQQLTALKPSLKSKIQEHGGLDHIAQHDTEALIDAQYSALGDEIYILSFCGEPEKQIVADNGLLSQWRGYGAGGGAALIFDTKKLEEILDREFMSYEYVTVFLADLIYSDNEQKLKEELSEDLQILADIAKPFFDYDNIRKKKQIDSSKGYFPFVRCITRYKHFGFCEENEVRVVALPTLIDDQIITSAKLNGISLKPEKVRKFRSNKGRRVPYIEVFDSTDIKLPIEKIIIGPRWNREARKAELLELLSKTNIEIVCSEIPYAD
ncbi:MAG: DUF2971 domain-containing protein [Deltaproteobacteria bacterium]|nr:DUF2971 domain-containing protein [Deltaproteobacteria bacterium]